MHNLKTPAHSEFKALMQKRHLNREQYFQEQEYTTQKFVIPFIERTRKIDSTLTVLEIGCGEGGNLKPFLDLGCRRVVGIDLSQSKIQNAQNYFTNHPNKKHIRFIADDIYNDPDIGRFDIIMIRDTIEHIPDQKNFLAFQKKYVQPGGLVFLGFPPWQNPFGGHQQMAENRFLSKVPYIHLLPVPVYRFILRSFGESDAKISGLLDVRETRITIERFESILKETEYVIRDKVFYLINPNYEVKFGLKPVKQSRLISSVPYLRNFLITANYYLISPANSSP
jgi:SAM-dependent methyltransferase